MGRTLEPPTGAGVGLNTYPINTTVAPAGTPGLGPNYSVAIDNTLGSFSPYQGRMYLVYIGMPNSKNLNNTTIEMLTLDTSGALAGAWFPQPALGQINDDAPGDDFSEGNRQQLNPTVTVDPVTGTVGVMWYDGRYDAEHTRVANSFTTSIDGGVGFRRTRFLNWQHTAEDFYTGATVFVVPTPDYFITAGALGFGDRARAWRCTAAASTISGAATSTQVVARSFRITSPSPADRASTAATWAR